MLYNTEAIVVKVFSYGENHAIVNLLTPTGLVAALARGAKKPQSRLAAAIQLCSQGVFSLYQKTGMATVQQAELTESRRALRENLVLAAYAAYFCELVQAVAQERPNGSEGMYRSFEAVLTRLAVRPEESELTSLLWESKILDWLGASPQWDVCVHCRSVGEAVVAYSPKDGGLICRNCVPTYTNHILVVPPALPRILESFRMTPVAKVGAIRLSTAVKEAAKKVLRWQMSDYGGLKLKSQAFLESLEADNLLGDILNRSSAEDNLP